MARHVKKGDTVEVIAGDNKGATGKVMRVMPDKRSGAGGRRQLVHKHVRPSQRNPQGGRIQVERPIHISNVLPVNPKTFQGHPGAVSGGRQGRQEACGRPTAARSAVVRRRTRK